MKNILDLLQVIISSILGCTILAVVLMFVLKIMFTLPFDLLAWVVKSLKRYTPKIGVSFFVWAVVLSLGLFALNTQISDVLQSFEQKEINPIYTFEYSENDAGDLAAFENTIQRNVSQSDFEILKKGVYSIADTLGCTPLIVYQVALSECALNPFAVHPLGCAAGWMQLTASGCSGLVLDGQSVTMTTVKAACENRDMSYIIRASNLYLLDRAKGKKIITVTDFYLLVFAPAFVGRNFESVLYEGYKNPSYYLNDGLDGYFVDGKGRIINLASHKDGRITVGELSLHVKRKTLYFLKKEKR